MQYYVSRYNIWHILQWYLRSLHYQHPSTLQNSKCPFYTYSSWRLDKIIICLLSGQCKPPHLLNGQYIQGLTKIRNVSDKFIRLNFFFYTCSSNSQACTKTCIILRAKQSSSSSPLLQPCLLESKATSREKKWNQEKTSEAKQTIRVDSFWNMHFCAYPKKITYTFYAHFSWSTFGLHLMSCPWPSKWF